MDSSITKKIEDWYKNYQCKDINITPYLWKMQEILDLAIMAIDDKYLYPKKCDENVRSHDIYKVWSDFYNNLDLTSEKRRIVISLSGGVDSMSLLYSIKNWKDNTNSDIEIIALHINFNNRKESYLEVIYLQHWCKIININLYVYEIQDYKRIDTPREEYEKTTRDIRFTLYKQLMNGYQGGVVLGHIRDDIRENIFRNISIGINMFEITGMKNISQQFGVTILRPFLDVDKKLIWDFAMKYHIPSFYNSTPEWSIRGRFREKLTPILENIFGAKCLDRFIDFGKKLESFGDWFYKQYECDYYSQIIVDIDKKIIKFPILSKYKNIPDIFWEKIIETICYKNQLKKPSKKSLVFIYDLIRINQDGVNENRKLQLSKNLTAEFKKNDHFWIINF